MKKNRWGLLTGITILSLMLVGCATPMHELTAEEEEIIVHYVAHVVAKYNVYQKDGMNSILPEETEETEEIEDSKDSEDSTEPGTEGGTEVDGDKVPEPESSIADKLGYTGLEITYTGSEFAAVYEESAGMSVVAPAGSTLYVMSFTMSNPTEAAIKVDNIALNPTFKLVKDGFSVKAEVTLLNKDLSTYVGEVQPGESVELVLLFEISDAKTDDVSGAALKVTTNE